MFDLEIDPKLVGIEYPGKIGQLQPAMAYRTRHSKTSRQHVDRQPERLFAFIEKCFHDLHQARKIPGMILVIVRSQQLSIVKLAQGQVDLGAAHVPGQNHREISNLPTPSARGGGNAAAAAASSSRVMRPV